MQKNQQEKQKEIIKKLGGFHYRSDIRNVFNDAVEFDALKWALHCELSHVEFRQQKQKEILARYQEKDAAKFLDICVDIENLLLGMIDNFNDYLGEIYMEIGAANKQNQQYFTPMCVGRLIANINLTDVDLTKPITTINDPACGSGGLLLAMLAELTNKKVNYTDRVLMVVNDIDKNCVNMCYLQLSFAGVPAVVIQQNTITQEIIGETFITPAFVLQYPKFKRIYDELNA